MGWKDQYKLVDQGDNGSAPLFFQARVLIFGRLLDVLKLVKTTNLSTNEYLLGQKI